MTLANVNAVKTRRHFQISKQETKEGEKSELTDELATVVLLLRRQRAQPVAEEGAQVLEHVAVTLGNLPQNLKNIKTDKTKTSYHYSIEN